MTKTLLLALVATLALFGCGQQNENLDTGFELEEENGLSFEQEESSKEEEQGMLIRLTSPQEGQMVKSPFLIAGEANVPGEVVYVQVKRTSGEVLISEQTSVSTGVDGLGTFGVLINFQFQSTDQGIVEVFGKTEEGEEVLKKSVEVLFDLPAQSKVEDL
jgi:hypothetical protein